MVPMVVERTASGERAFDIYSRLLRDRIVFVGSEIDDQLAGLVIAQLLFLDGEDQAGEITLYINSPGGSGTAGLAVYDAMQHVRAPVRTVCVGLAASAASLLLAGGAAGRREALPHSRILIHQPWGGAQGQETDIRIRAQEMETLRRQIDAVYARHTGRSEEQIHADTERDHFMGPEMARAYGLIDSVLG
ncbi:MAG TPA: ATP-dependent Clp protease proteolytic subunit [Candidatus Micrarchaeia archaeon]|nr:ATP-dependent Clp protease proteolytic subunit [Candidatus Micrarchaeia archaeon]